MNNQSVEEILLLLRKFEERTLPKAEWTHAARLKVGLIYCCLYQFDRACNQMGNGSYWLNVAHATPNDEAGGYHETLTIFWLRLVWRFLEKRGRNEDLTILAGELIKFYTDPNLPLKFYSRELLFSREAREHYVKPDLPSCPIAEETSSSRNFIFPFLFGDSPSGQLQGF
jgi:hypothetical protein